MSLSPFQSFIKRYHIDKAAFFAVVVIGAAAIVTFDELAFPKLAAVAVCVILMFAYGGLTFFLPGLRLRRDQSADNCYYIGLLFTLTSLLMALIRFASSSEATDFILRNFGIAISTTIVGLALRVFVSQFREDPEDLEFEARDALAETVRKLRTELDQSITELQHFADGARQALDEAATSAVTSMKATSEAIREGIDAAAKTFSEGQSAFLREAEELSSSLAEASGTISSLSSRIGSIRADPDLVERGLAPAIGALESRVGILGTALDREQERIVRSLSTLENLSVALNRFEGSTLVLDQASSRLAIVTERFGQGTEALDHLRVATGSAVDGLARLGQQVGAAANTAGTAAERAVNQVEQSAVVLAQRTGQGLGEVERAASAAIDTLRRLNEELASSGDTVVRVRRELAEIAHWIVSRLDETP